MKLPLEWIAEIAGIPMPSEPKHLADLWTASGTKVERVGSAGPLLPGVRIGSVLEAEKHPNADRLRVCKVRMGAEVLSIVCGAPNVAAGQKVAVATVGTALPGDRKIEKAKIRGAESQGMICSAVELGIGAESDGILVLPADALEGEAFDRYAGLSEPIVEFEITYNRPDCLSVIGVAREIVAVLGNSPLKIAIPVVEERGPATSDSLRVELPDASLCTHYAVRIVDDVQISESPTWMKKRLERSGVRSINNVVDVTNYVMLELGQPLHAFDFSAVQGGLLQVRRAQEGETLKTLDGVVRKLSSRHVVIADARRPIALAGTMGGEEESISPRTKTVLIESACFVPAAIRESARAAGIRSEASVRFSGGTDPGVVRLAADRAAQLLSEVAGGKVRAGIVDKTHPTSAVATIPLRASRLRELLGADVPLEEASRILSALQFQVTPGAEALHATAPTHRRDIREETDLVEEIARLRHDPKSGARGYDLIPEALPTAIAAPEISPSRRLEQTIRRLLVGAGLFEARTYSLVPSRSLREVDHLPHQGGRPVRIDNFLTEDMDTLRWSIVPGLLESAAHNARHGNRSVSLFEMGRTFADSGTPDPLALESRKLAWVVAGGSSERHWIHPGRDRNFYDAKGIAEMLAEVLRLPPLEFTPATEAPQNVAVSERSAEVRTATERLGWVGEIDPALAEKLDLPAGSAAAELDLDTIARFAHLEPQAPALPKFPAARRDIALVVDASVPAARLLILIRKTAGRSLREVEVFDVYAGEPLPAGKRSLAFALTFQASDRSLTDAELASAIEAIVRVAEREFGAELRR